MNTWTLDAEVVDVDPRTGSKGGKYHYVTVKWGDHSGTFFVGKGVYVPRVGEKVRLSGILTSYKNYAKPEVDKIVGQGNGSAPASRPAPQEDYQPPAEDSEDLPF